MSPERIKPQNFETAVIGPEEFSNLIPSPERLQELVYSLYTRDGVPQSVIPHESSPLSKLYELSDKKTAYIIISGDAERLFQSAVTEHLKKIESELREYKGLAGFLKIEWGLHKPHENLPIEAMVLTKNFPWPADVIVGYAASFTTNPLLPKQVRIEIQKNMHIAAYTLAKNEGFSNNIYSILAPHVATFVEASGLIAIKEPGPNELSDDPYAKSIFETFPGYWSEGPSTYRFDPDVK